MMVGFVMGSDNPLEPVTGAGSLEDSKKFQEEVPLKDLQEDFNEFDRNRDTFVDPEEVRTLLMKSDNNKTEVQAHVVDFFLRADEDGSGTVSFAEYQGYHKSFAAAPAVSA